jgi:hypothetical protein
MDRIELEELLREVLTEVAPNFSLEEDEQGQLFILLGLTEDPDTDELITFDSEEDEDFDSDESSRDELDDEEE